MLDAKQTRPSPVSERVWLRQTISVYDIHTTVAPTSTDSSVFIRILRGMYGYTGTMLHYTEECARRFRGQL